jgi:hypothetical protein
MNPYLVFYGLVGVVVILLIVILFLVVRDVRRRGDDAQF